MATLNYDAGKVYGKLLAEAVSDLNSAIDKLGRWHARANTATGGSDFSKIEVTEFGIDTGNGQAIWNAAVSLKDLLAANGIPGFKSSLDVGL